MYWATLLLTACSTTGNGPVVEDADLDEDGLSFSQEAALGSDPHSADTDGDGTPDGAEAEAGTDPLDPFSRPYAGGYALGACPASPLVGSGTGLGQVPPNMDLVDQHGELLSTWSFCGRLTVLLLCTPEDCSAHARRLDGWLEDHGEAGLSGLVVLPFHSSGWPLDEGDVTAFVDEAGIERAAVLRDPGMLAFLSFEQDWSTPSWVVLDRNHSIVALDEGQPDIEALLD